MTFVWSQDHPRLILTRQGVENIRASIGEIPLFDKSLRAVQEEVDRALKEKVDVPVPKDLAGGYTHEKHKSNFFLMQKAGVLYQITQNEKYAIYIRDMLLDYSKIYPTLDKHPAIRSYARGKLFWQCLNDANWLVYTSQAYDCIYDWLDEKTRNKLNQELFRPYAEYISVENPQFFNRIHNHSTWGNAAVGMVGLVIGDEELVQWALYGLNVAMPHEMDKDNDGGSIRPENHEEAGFLAQIDHSFSPDGYYTEGPYYQRYAMYPFLIFAQGLANKMPELDILNYRDGLLLKAVSALVNQTNAQGEFFPINDAQKGMSLASRELVNAVSMAYQFGGNDTGLLSIVENQGRVPLNDSGLITAKAIAAGKSTEYKFESLELSDGPSGDEGAIGIIRAEDLTLVMKYAKHGMGHGHFDRLGFLLYDETGEIIQDYGAARWVNVEHKDGGGYLKENHSWAKETIAHNTLVVNKDSHFDHDVRKADDTSGTPYCFIAGEEVQIVSAKETKAYDDVSMHRTMAVVEIDELENPIIIDLFSVQGPAGSRYDLPLYYLGEFMSSNQKFQVNNNLSPMGEASGYQHLWAEGQTAVEGDDFRMTWFNNKKFYTITSVAQQGDEILLTRIGANDPNLNLRRDPGLIHRRTGDLTTFASLYEVHGTYDYSSERPLNLFTSVDYLKLLHQSKDYVAIQLKLKNGEIFQFAFSLKDASSTSRHKVSTALGNLNWQGIYDFKRIDQ